MTTQLGMRESMATLRDIAGTPTMALSRLSAQYPDALGMHIGRQKMVLINDAPQAWELLTTHARATKKGRGLELSKSLLGEGLLTIEGEEHLRQRRALQPTFHPSQLAGYLSFMLAAAQRSSDQWHDGQQVELTRELSALTLDAVATSLFGNDLRDQADDVKDALDAFTDTFRVAMLPWGVRYLQVYPPRARQLDQALQTLDGVVATVVSRLREHRATAQPIAAQGNTAPGATTFAEQLLNSQIGLSDGQIRDHVMTLMLAGHETTAMGLTWAHALLHAHPEMLNDLEREWDTLTQPLTPATLPAQLPLTTAVVAETFRLRPPAWIIGRRATAPFTVGDMSIEPGTMLMIAPAALHRDPRWWAEPDRFNPGRWLVDGLDGPTFRPRIPDQPRGAYLPFGAGPRVCIGEQFAWIEATALLATIGRHWRIEVQPPVPDPGRASITLRPGGAVRATLHARASLNPA